MITLLLIAVLAVNIIAFGIVGLDKNKSVQDHQRIREVYFFVWAAFFGSVGVLMGMLLFHHKTRKWYFPLGITALIIQQSILIYLLI